MNYQIGNDNSNQGYDNGMFRGVGMSSAGKSDKDGMNSILKNNSVGDLLACKLVKGGNEPLLDLNGIQIKTRASKELDQAKEGDTIYLKIQEADKNQVSLKIVGIQSAEGGSQLDAVTSAQVMQSTEQFSDMIKDNIGGALDEKEAKENQKEIFRNLTTEEIAKLRMMQIDVTNSTLSDLLGMVISFRQNEHIDEVNEILSDIAEETIGKLRESMKSGHEAVANEAPEAASVEAEAPVTISRLNSEGYVVSHVADKGASTYGADAARAVKDSNFGEVSISEEQMAYLVKNNLDLTIENLYKAQSSVNETGVLQSVPFNDKVWNDIYPQVTNIIESAGMTVSEQSLSGARFMLTHELPITVDSLRLFMAVESLNQRGLQEVQTKANIDEQVAMGNPAEQARINGSTLRERAERLVEKTHTITMQAVDSAVNQGKPITLSYLYNSTMRNAGVRRMGRAVTDSVEGASLSLSGDVGGQAMPDSNIALSTNPSAVTARRQLEEIRLSMTTEAALRLVNKDINIDAKPLSVLVDELRKQENSYYENVVSSQDIHDLPEDTDLLKETLKETEGLKVLPEYALGEMVRRPSITLNGLYESAVKIKAVLAGNAYETMMTKPRRDMGDSINEAFQNVDAILEDMNLDRNEENQRAIRILAYNEMELSQGNITSVKAADAKVQQLFETLTPQIVLNLIRENKNPLNMTIDGLNQEIMEQREVRGVTDEQRFSEFLYQMDRNNAITEDERKSFIGIYRLLDRIEKSHGKDIGAVIRNGQEVTLHNLFAADKSRKARGINVGVDDNFGERVDVSTPENDILNQIETAYNQTLTGSIMRHLRPETLKNLETVDYENMSFEELNSIMKASDTQEGQAELSEQLREDIMEALDYADDVEMMLEANDMPKTVTNMIAAHQVMHGEDGIYGMVHGLKRNLVKEARDEISRCESRILETLESREDVIYGMENLRSTLSQAVHDKEADGTITAMDIQALKYINAGMPIAMRAVSEDVFQVPLIVGEDVSIMKVSILQDGSHAGEIRATVDTAKYGVLETFVHVEGNQIEGYMTTEEEKGQHALEDNELTIRSVFAKAGMEVRDFRLDGTKPVLYGGISEEEIATAKLYRVAKHLLTAIKLTGIAADN